MASIGGFDVYIMYFWFMHHFGFLANLLSSLWCIFPHVFPSHLSTIIGCQGAHSSQPPFVRTSHGPSLIHYSCHTLATNRVILLAFVQNHGQGITVRPTAGTPTQNGLRSNWDFLSGISPYMLVGPTLSTSSKELHIGIETWRDFEEAKHWPRAFLWVGDWIW